MPTLEAFQLYRGELQLKSYQILILFFCFLHKSMDLRYIYTVKPAHVVTCIKRPSLSLSCHRKFHMN